MDRSQTYQIKSTPFMRRMVSTSTKSGELQRLKQEYERIKNFNERTIEKQMRHARLRRLYRVIEIIKESQPERVRARAKTEEHLRAEQIVKARQLGMEFSRRNAVQMEQQRPASVQRPEHLKFRFEPHNPKDEVARRNRSSRRLAYGNELSRKNREQIVQGSTKRVTLLQAPEASDPTEEKRKRLSERIKYGNNCSTLNLVQLQRLKNTTQETHIDMAQLRWLDSINRSNVTDYCSSAAAAALYMQNIEKSITMPAEKQEIGQRTDTELPIHDLSINQETTEIEATLTPESTARDNSLELASAICSRQADSTLQQVKRYFIDALKKPFVLSKSKSIASDVQPLENEFPDKRPLEHHKSMRRRTSSVGRVQVKDVTNEEDEQSELHQVSNSTNLQSFYTQVKNNDLGSSTSEYILPPGTVDDTMTPDELVLSCQRYMDYKSDDEKRDQRPGKYDSNILSPYEINIDLSAKLIEQISTIDMDKEKLLTLGRVQNLRSIFEN